MTKASQNNENSISISEEKSKEYPLTKIEKEYSEFIKSVEKGSKREADLFAFGMQKFLHYNIECMNNDQFVYTFISSMKIVPTTEIPTLGISLDKKYRYVTLYYNPIFIAFFATKSKDYLNFFMLHEIMHVSFSFFSRCENVEDLLGDLKKMFPAEEQIHKLKNIAHDLSINCTIQQDTLSNIKDDELIGCFPGKGFFKDYPSFLPMEEYFIRLAKDEKIQQGMGGEYWVIDEHSFLDSLDGLSDEERTILRNEIREISQKAISASKNHGNESHLYLKKLEQLIGPPKINAEEVLKFFIEKSISINKRPSIRKINKKVPYIYPGKNKTKSAKLAICVDQSGSVDDDLLVKLLKICALFADETHIDLIPFDCGNIIEEKIRRYTPGMKFQYERVLTGGTNFQMPTDFVNTNGTYDGMIVCTDLEAPMPGPCSIDRVWLTSERCSSAAIEGSGELVLKFPDSGNKT